MAGKKDLVDALRYLATPTEDLTPFMGTVIASSYNATNKTVDIDPLDGSAKLLGVLINANSSNGFLLVPKDNSVVGVIMTSNTTGYVALVSEVDSIILAGEENGGIIKVTQLTAKINALITQISSNFTAIAATYPYTIVPLTAFNENDYQNTIVKHGNG